MGQYRSKDGKLITLQGSTERDEAYARKMGWEPVEAPAPKAKPKTKAKAKKK